MSDKRSVATDALETLGTAPIPDGSGRDAIHLAVYPAIASERLLAGQDICLLPDGRAAKSKDNAVGIVDPFLKKSVQPGEKFWLVVYPRQITSLRHVWEHPAFLEERHPAFHEEEVKSEITDADRDKAKLVAERLTGSSAKWLERFCSDNDCPSWGSLRDLVINGSAQLGDEEHYGKSYIDGEYVHISGMDAHAEIPDEFWDHVENVTGKKVAERPTHFSCSC